MSEQYRLSVRNNQTHEEHKLNFYGEDYYDACADAMRQDYTVLTVEPNTRTYFLTWVYENKRHIAGPYNYSDLDAALQPLTDRYVAGEVTDIRLLETAGIAQAASKLEVVFNV